MSKHHSQSLSKKSLEWMRQYKYLGFEMKKGEVERKEMMAKLEDRIKEKLVEPTSRELERLRRGIGST